MLEELDSERRDLRAWEERLKGTKAELEREKAVFEGEPICRGYLNQQRVERDRSSGRGGQGASWVAPHYEVGPLVVWEAATYTLWEYFSNVSRAFSDWQDPLEVHDLLHGTPFY